VAAPILPISGAAASPAVVHPAGETKGTAFQDVFANAIQQVESFGQQASSSIERFLAGEGEELHNTVLATTRAELSFEMFLQVRNKVVGAYQEIMKMQV
jgi:flagellar hook-basal body complex protein FliE